MLIDFSGGDIFGIIKSLKVCVNIYAYSESISNSPYLDDKIKRNKKILAG